MKKIFAISLVFLLVACGSPAKPTAAPAPATEAPAMPTDTVAPAEAPSDTPAPAEVPTDTPAAAAPAGSVTSGPFTITVSGNQFALSCASAPASITFDVSTEEPAVDDVYLFTRMEDKLTGHVADWSSGQAMQKLGGGKFTYTFNATSIGDSEKFKQAWMDYQFAGDNKLSQVVGRSDKYTQQISFTIACP